MKIVASIVNWNTAKFLEDCLDSFFDKTKGIDFELWVFDNGSKDESKAVVKKSFPKVKLVENKENIGFGKAHNSIFDKTDSEYFAVINSDVVFKNNLIKILSDFLDKNKDAAAVSCKLLNADGSLQKNISVFPSLTREFAARLPFIKNPYLPEKDYSNVQEVESFSGACFLIRRSAIKEKLFDSTFFAYAEETDLFYRLKKDGWIIFYEPKAKAFHYGGASSSGVQKQLLYFNGVKFFFAKHFGLAKTIAFRLMVFFLTFAKLVFAALSFNKNDFDLCKKIIMLCFS